MPEAGSVSNATTGKSEAREARHNAAQLGVITLMLFVALQPLPKPKKTAAPLVTQAVAAGRFEDAWSERTESAAPKTDKEKKVVRIIPLPVKPVITERIILTAPHSDASPVVEPSVAAPPPTQDVRVVRLRRHAEKDVCARHGMKTVHYGKRWRCRR